MLWKFASVSVLVKVRALSETMQDSGPMLRPDLPLPPLPQRGHGLSLSLPPRSFCFVSIRVNGGE
jgi:hypothetical protein